MKEKTEKKVLKAANIEISDRVMKTKRASFLATFLAEMSIAEGSSSSMI